MWIHHIPCGNDGPATINRVCNILLCHYYQETLVLQILELTWRTWWREEVSRSLCAGETSNLNTKMSSSSTLTVPRGIQTVSRSLQTLLLISRNTQADQVLTFTFIYKKIVERIKYKHLEKAIKASLRCPGRGRQRIKKLTRFRVFKLAEVITIIFHWLLYRQWPL